MKESKEEHRKIYPLPFEQISKLSSFEQILGKNENEYSEEERKKRWKKAMSFSKASREYWNDLTVCADCKHVSGVDAWCNLIGLPCTVNPTLTFKYGCKGEACQGLGYESVSESDVSESSNSDLPF